VISTKQPTIQPLDLVPRSAGTRNVNVGDIERLATLLGGGALAFYGLSRRSPGGIVLACRLAQASAYQSARVLAYWSAAEATFEWTAAVCSMARPMWQSVGAPVMSILSHHNTSAAHRRLTATVAS